MAKLHRTPAVTPARTHKAVSVRLDVATDLRVSVAAGLAGLDKSTYLSKIISRAVSGIVVIDRRKSGDRVDVPGEADTDIGEDVAA